VTDARRRGWLLLVSVLANVLTLVLAVTLVNRTLEEFTRQVCSIWAADLDIYRETPPSTATGKRLQQAKTELYRVRGCHDER